LDLRIFAVIFAHVRFGAGNVIDFKNT